MEVAASANEVLMDGILGDSIGRKFQRLYDNQGLQTSLGLPKAMSYSGPDASWNYQLPFQNGVMTLNCPSRSTPCS